MPHYNGGVAQRPANPVSVTFANFDRAFDELFEELLLSRWRCARKDAPEEPKVAESETEYRVLIDAAGAEPDRMEVEVSDRRLLVRIASASGTHISRLDFSHAIEADRVTARLAGGALEIVLPKKRGRIVEVR
jgi:HSP20 family molecular chaperone IbpA